MPPSTILCVSANPAMDRRLRVGSFFAGAVNRARTAQGFAGGKAAHVAMAGRALGAHAVWIGFLGGAIGETCRRQLESLGIEVVSVPTAAETRVNLEIIEDSGKITEVLEPGQEPTADEKHQFHQQCAGAMRKVGRPACLVISGSLPAGVAPGFYMELIAAAHAQGARVLVDTSAAALRACSAANPEFVKTNRAEATELLGSSLATMQEAAAAAHEIIEGGSRSAAITLGEEGLVWAESKNGPVWRARPPRLNVISTVGCGDATLAGFAEALCQQVAGEEAIRLAAACGAANCLAVAPGRIERATVQSLLPRIEVERLS